MGPLSADRQAAEVRSPTELAIFFTKTARRIRRARKNPAHRPLTGFERLETRSVLSANVIPAPTFDLAIRGTDVQFSPLGLPSAMGGDIYLAAGAATGHAAIGRYQETLTPILMDVNGDQVPDFVGTQGVATFRFFVGAPQFSFGSITTADVSYIQGVTAAGQMLVGSQGTIVASAGMLRGLAGGFDSQSTVGLMPTFTMQTNVHFTVNRSVTPALAVLTIAADLVSGASANLSTHTGGSTATLDTSHGTGDSDGASTEAGGHHDNAGQNVGKHDADLKHDAHDSIFADNLDWRPGKAKEASLL